MLFKNLFIENATEAMDIRVTDGKFEKIAANIEAMQGSLNGVQVIGVGDGCHRSTVHGAVSLDSNLALCIGNLFDTNNSFHCTSCLLTSAARRR